MENIKSPELFINNKRYAYDYNGEKWQVKAIATSDGSTIKGCASLVDLLNTYDYSGITTEYINDGDVDECIVVGAYSETYGRVAWIWGGEGICYENE